MFYFNWKLCKKKYFQNNRFRKFLLIMGVYKTIAIHNMSKKEKIGIV